MAAMGGQLAEAGVLQGSCGYGLLNMDVYPYWSAAALSTSSTFYKNDPVQGCGCGSGSPANMLLPLAGAEVPRVQGVL